MTDEPDDPSFIPQAYLAEVGRIANAWAALEFSVDQATWALSGLPDMFGACLTAQMFSASAKLRALAALAEVRGFSPETVKHLKRFSSKEISPLQERRNRAVHDTRLVRERDGAVARLQITAQGPLVFGFQQEPLADLRKTRRRIEDVLRKFFVIRDEMITELQTLPNITELGLQAIKRTPLESGGGIGI